MPPPSRRPCPVRHWLSNILCNAPLPIFIPGNLPIIPKLFFMLSYSNYSQNYSGIIDGSLEMIQLVQYQQQISRCMTTLTSSWKKIGSLSSARSRVAVAAVYNNVIIVIGGCTRSDTLANVRSSSLTVVELGQAELLHQLLV